MEFEVRRIGPESTVGAADVLADAFDGYPWTAWTVAADRHRERLAAMFAGTVEAVGLPYGDVWAAVGPDGRPAAVAVWLRPDRPVPDEVWAGVAARDAELAGDRHVAMSAADAACAPLRSPEPAFLLATVGVRRADQGRGLGGRVLLPGLAEADRAGLPAVLETSSEGNVRFYRRLGFAVTGQVRVPDGGPRVWAMRRPAGRAAAAERA
ncbi:Acetyltransferase (GNAT) family protein [Micromonospora citrea]|uniref:Acetyltransferase (GNAT) family protein n=1 Tax=Micromonospora citrea TaxID=47855 RepID=A0A1C6TQB0_9ACTN|nr:GNAT family N-acetyltransferase [Micromonospora citrea]SCL43957.1 Acetyltransferase (GNAT) family protein [Micromonospora citrea]SCL73078.1 Acetyltransferase (GNAT) family protein [Micromonospora citrea]